MQDNKLENLNVPQTLYHYCGLNAFESIIKNHSIWLTDVQQSNDYTEIEWIYKHIEEYCSQLAEGSDESGAKGETAGEKMNAMPTDNMRQTSSLMRSVKDDKILQTFAFCMSAEGDQLSQWRGYADDGNGVAIGFKGQAFQPFLFCAGHNMGKLFNLAKIQYDEVSEEALQTLLPKWNAELRNSAHEYRAEAVTMGILLYEYAAIYKNPAFNEEKEWRLFAQIPRGKDTYSWTDAWWENNIRTDPTIQDCYQFSTDGFLFKRDRMVRYIELQFLKPKQIVQEIVLGPKCKIDPINLHLFLQKNGFEDESRTITIRQSTASYR